MNALVRVSALALLTVGLVGCADRGVKKVTIDGTVTYKGQPVSSGILRVVSAGGEFATAPIRTDGTFTLTDVVPGEIKVGIIEAPPAGGSSSDGGKKGPVAKPVALPAKYKDPQSSGLQYTVSDDGNPLVIELK